MSLIIRNMKIPKQGRVTLQIGADGAVYVVDKCEITAEKYEKNFEVFEVPTPHGKLIDADAMNEKYGDWYTEEGTEEGFIGALKYLIAEQPIIIEAEGT